MSWDISTSHIHHWEITWQNNAAVVKKSHLKCVLLGYLKINSIRNKYSHIPCLIENNLDVFITAETKLGSSFPESQFLL